MRLFTCGREGAETRGRPPPPAAPRGRPPPLTLSRYRSRISSPQLEQTFLPADGVEEEEDGGEQTDGVEGVLGAERASSFSRAPGSGSPSGCDCGQSRRGAVSRGPAVPRSPRPGASRWVPAAPGPERPGGSPQPPASPARRVPAAPGPASPRPRLPWRGRAGRGSGRSPWAAAPAASPCGREREREAAAPCAGGARGTLYKPPQNNK